jgi:peptidoglycan biosynthesis protein MviN/MurJ (putative lipid II flippase)
LICNLITLAVTAGLTLGLAPAIGASGSAVATVAGEWTLAISLLIALVRAKRQLVPKAWTVAPRVALAGGAAFAMMLLPIPAVAQLALAVAVYTAMIVVLRTLPLELLELLPARSRRIRRT